MREAITGLTIVLIGLFGASGCQRDAKMQAVPAMNAAAQAPHMYFDYEVAWPMFRTSVSSGLRLAVWEDGIVLFGSDPNHPTKDMRVGQLHPAELKAAWEAVRTSGLTTTPDGCSLAPDDDCARIVHLKDGKTQYWLWGNPSGADWWPKAEEALAKFRPATSQPVAEVATDGMYRGYNVKEWWRTSWRR